MTKRVLGVMRAWQTCLEALGGVQARERGLLLGRAGFSYDSRRTRFNSPPSQLLRSSASSQPSCSVGVGLSRKCLSASAAQSKSNCCCWQLEAPPDVHQQRRADLAEPAC